MTDTTLLTKIKNGLGITGTFQDQTLQVYIDDVKAFMKSAGVKEEVIESEVSVGCIMRGVADLWKYGAGDTNLSNYFKMRLLQLKKEEIEEVDVEKLAPYFYAMNSNDLDYAAGYEFFKKFKPIPSACACVRKDNLFGRNYDWNYDERCSFYVATKATNGRHATIGVAQGTSNLTQEFIDSGKYSDDYKIVPFLLLDGINDAGVICEMNVAPNDKGLTTGTNAEGEDLMAIMIPRFVLDYAGSVDEAITLLQSRNIICPNNSGVQLELHFMIADPTKTVVVEFVENEMKVIESFVNDKPIMTNFFIDGFDGTKESLTLYGQGFERYQILSDGFDSVNSELGMLNLMQQAQFTKAYHDDVRWYSDFVGGEYTNETPTEQFEPLLAQARELYQRRTRNGETWQTVHTSVYDIEQRKLTVIPQESGQMFSFKLGV